MLRTRDSSRDGTGSSSAEFELHDRIHSDIPHLTQHLVPGVRVQIKLTKSRLSFYLMTKEAESKTVFKFLDDKLKVNRVKVTPGSCWRTKKLSRDII